MSNGRSNINIVGNTTSGANTGTGAGLYGGKCNTNTLLFKTISALGTGIAVINCNNQIYISGNTGGGGTYTFGNGLCNLGGLVRLGGLMTCETVFDGDASFGITYCDMCGLYANTTNFAFSNGTTPFDNNSGAYICGEYCTTIISNSYDATNYGRILLQHGVTENIIVDSTSGIITQGCGEVILCSYSSTTKSYICLNHQFDIGNNCGTGVVIRAANGNDNSFCSGYDTFVYGGNNGSSPFCGISAGNVYVIGGDDINGDGFAGSVYLSQGNGSGDGTSGIIFGSPKYSGDCVTVSAVNNNGYTHLNIHPASCFFRVCGFQGVGYMCVDCGGDSIIFSCISHACICAGRGRELATTKGYDLTISGGQAACSNDCGGNLILRGGIPNGSGSYGRILACNLPAKGSETCVIYIDSSGNLSTGVPSSDCRLKCNIRPISNAISLLDNVCGYSAEFNELSRCCGCCEYVFLAQEIEKNLPLAVKDGVIINDEKYKLVEYSQMIPILWNIVKEQNKKIMELENKINK